MRRRTTAAVICVLVCLFLAACGEKDITAEEALSAIKKYCYSINPDLESIADSGEYPVYWDVQSADKDEIVVLFRSYTGALTRYYIDPVSGDAYVTEFMPGISADEERTGENLNVRDYLK